MITTKEFQTAKMDGTTKSITFILLIFLPILALSSYFIEPPKLLVSVSLTVLFMAVILISYCFVPKRIAISEDQILIRNLFGAVIINIAEIKSIGKIEKRGFHLRTFGVGGLFGYFGYFNGKDVWYVTNTYKKIKIILLTGKIYMVSPENPEDFIKEVEERKSELL